MKVVGTLVPRRLYRYLAGLRRQTSVGGVDFGDLRRLTPISTMWGEDRGIPIDRFYIERFLSPFAGDVRGRTLEVGTDLYTVQFGGDRVTHSDVLHVAEDNPKVTVIADLTRGDGLESSAYDCVILTQTLQFIYDVRSALATVHRILAPGGTLLATFPGISKLSRYDMDRWGHHWGFTTASARRLFSEPFGDSELHIEAYGNVLTSIAFLHGLSATELTEEELNHVDPDYELLVGVRAVKSDAER